MHNKQCRKIPVAIMQLLNLLTFDFIIVYNYTYVIDSLPYRMKANYVQNQVLVNKVITDHIAVADPEGGTGGTCPPPLLFLRVTIS